MKALTMGLNCPSTTEVNNRIISDNLQFISSWLDKAATVELPNTPVYKILELNTEQWLLSRNICGSLADKFPSLTKRFTVKVHVGVQKCIRTFKRKLSFNWIHGADLFLRNHEFFSWKINSRNLSNPLVYYLFHQTPPILLILGHVNSFPVLRNDFFKEHFNWNVL
jgi:hypothetical protein